MADDLTLRQLLLDLPVTRSGQFLEAPSNEAARAWLARRTDWPQRRLAVSGETGSGKTHLLLHWARQTGAAWWPGQTLAGVVERAFDRGMCVAVDDADKAAERPLLHLLNAAAEAKVWLLLAGREPPARWTVTLPDLKSRLRSMASVGLMRPDDDLLRGMLYALLDQRQLVMRDDVVRFLLTRLPREGVALRDAVERLDHMAMQMGGPITIDLARMLLHEASGSP